MGYLIKPILEHFGVKFVKNGADNSGYYVCPLCGSKKMNANYQKNIWRCNKCQEGGGVKALVSAVLGVSDEKAVRYLRDISAEFAGSFSAYDPISFSPEPTRASEENLDRVYREMLRLLSLSRSHREDLRNRGLDDAAIHYCHFKSLPKPGDNRVASILVKKGMNLRGVPGFYREKGVWKINSFPSGYLVPFRNVNGKITGLQVRNDEPNKGTKYMSFTSTGKKGGTQSKIEAHLTGYDNQKEVFLTEGALKAEVACYLMQAVFGKKLAFLAIPGVNNTSSLQHALELLKEKGVTRIYDCFDMDKVGTETIECNIHVQDAVKKIEDMVRESGFDWKTVVWSKGKGIDDFLLIRSQKKKKN